MSPGATIFEKQEKDRNTLQHLIPKDRDKTSFRLVAWLRCNSLKLDSTHDFWTKITWKIYFLSEVHMCITKCASCVLDTRTKITRGHSTALATPTYLFRDVFVSGHLPSFS